MSKHCPCVNEHEIEQPKLRVLERLTDGSDHDKNEKESSSE